MANAIIQGILRENSNCTIYGYDPNNLISGVEKLNSNVDVVKNSDIIFFCTKPFVIRDVFEEIKDYATDEKLFVLIQFMQAENLQSVESKEERLNRKRIAFEKLKSLCKPIPDLDYDKEKDEYMEEKFGRC